MDGKETVRNSSWGELRWEGASKQRGRTGNRGKSLWESSVDGSVDIVDGWETVGNSLGRAPLGCETEAWTLWTDGKPWGIIAWGELCWERARRKRDIVNGSRGK